LEIPRCYCTKAISAQDKGRDTIPRFCDALKNGEAALKKKRGLIPLIIITSYGLLLLAWAIGNPPFAGADESAHYQRAIGVGQGHLIGPKATVTVPAGSSSEAVTMFEWVNDATRTVDIRGGMLLPNPECNAHNTDVSASCLLGQHVIPHRSNVIIPVGNYQPEAYLLPGALLNHVHDPLSADRLARLGTATICLILLTTAIELLWTGEIASLLGLLVAVTPMVLFTNAILNPSGLEISTSITFIAAILALHRRASPTGWVWAAMAISGAMLALSRSPGPVWVLLGLVLMASLEGRRDGTALLRQNRVAATISLLALVAAMALNQVWEVAYGSHLDPSAAGFLREIPSALYQLPNLIREEVGSFGSLDSPLALPLPASWLLFLLTLVCLAFYLGNRRERIVVAATAILNLVVAVLFYAVFLAGSGFAAQGRHLLPFGVFIPLLAVDVVSRHRERLSPRLVGIAAMAIPLAVGGIQAAAWYGNARRQAVGINGPLWFIPYAEWQPPLGWWTWTAVVLAAAALLGGAGLMSRDGRHFHANVASAPGRPHS
jgi:hypothetical protein